MLKTFGISGETLLQVSGDLERVFDSRRKLQLLGLKLIPVLNSFVDSGSTSHEQLFFEFSEQLRCVFSEESSFLESSEFILSKKFRDIAELQTWLCEALRLEAVRLAHVVLKVLNNTDGLFSQEIVSYANVLVKPEAYDSNFAAGFIAQYLPILQILVKADESGLVELTGQEIELLIQKLGPEIISIIAKAKPKEKTTASIAAEEMTELIRTVEDKTVEKSLPHDSPAAILESVDERILDCNIVDLPLETRAKNVLIRNKYRTIRQLSALGNDDLMNLKGMGASSVHAIVRCIRTLCSEDYPNNSSNDLKRNRCLLELFLDWWEHQKDRDRVIGILMRRWGGYGRQYTLQETADEFGLTRERIRQLTEKYQRKLRFIYGARLDSKISQLLDDREVPLYLEHLEEEDEYFAGFADLKADGIRDPYLFLGHMIESVTRKFFVCTLDDRYILCRVKQGELDFGIISARRELATQSVNSKLTIAGAHDYVGEFCKSLNVPELAAHIIESLSGKLNYVCLADDIYLGTVGTTAVSKVLAVLRSAEKPLHYTQVAERCRLQYGKEVDIRRVTSSLQEVGLLFDSGTYGLKQHLGLPEDVENRIREQLEYFLDNGNVDKQWHCDELLELLREYNPELAEHCDQYTISIILKESNRARYLRRFVWVHSDSDLFAANDRKQVHDCCLEILDKSGRPLTNDQLLSEIGKIRGIQRNMQIQPLGNLIRVDRGVWGLLDRDVPMNEFQRKEMIDDVVRLLGLQMKPIHISELTREVPSAEILTSAMFASVLQSDARIRVDRNQCAYLNSWGVTKGESIRDLLTLEMAGASRPLSIEELFLNIQENFGRNVSKGQLRAALANMSAAYDRDGGGWTLLSRESTPC